MLGFPTKVVLIGLDGAIPGRILKYVEAGHLPNLTRLIEDGAWADNCLGQFPTITPPNWTTIATGARVETHGITGFHLHRTGTALDELYQALSTEDCRAEYIWDAAAREGKRAIILSYPGSWPPTVEDSIVVGGGGVNVDEWRIGLPSWYVKVGIGDNKLFATEPYPEAVEVQVRSATGWRNGPDEKAKEVELPFDFPTHGRRSTSRGRVEEKTYHVYLPPEDNGTYRRTILCREKDLATKISELRVEEWSDLIVDSFIVDGAEVLGRFKCKLLVLSPEGNEFKLYFTSIFPNQGWSHPKQLASEIPVTRGLECTSGAERALYLEWIDWETALETEDMKNEWYAEAIEYLCARYSWDMLFMQTHTMDYINHRFWPLVGPGPTEGTEWEKYELWGYQSVDRLIGGIVKVAGEEALIIVVSDHGAVPSAGSFNGVDALVKAGLTVLEPPEIEGLPAAVRWDKTRAFAQRAGHVYVNLKGRDPSGIVDPEEYDLVRDEIISALYDYTDPEMGRKPVLLALRREDARLIGMDTDRAGDVFYAVGGGFRPQIGGVHGLQAPTVQYGEGSMRAVLLMAGPGIKRGTRVMRTVGLEDIVPTICYLTDLPMPRDVDGGIIYQFLSDPDARRGELHQVRRNYQRLLRANQFQSGATHTY